ncbi:MAG: choice-of-anchor A family protein [Tepidisphaeraceae bacterium]
MSLMLASTAAMSQAAHTGLGPAGGYNVYVLGDNTQAGSDIQNGIAVGGNFITAGTTVAGNVIVGGQYSNNGNTISGNVIANSANINNPTITGTLSTVGNTQLTGGGSVGGGVFYGGTYTGLGYITRTQVSPASVVYPFSFAEANSYLTSLASGLHGLGASAGTSVTGGAGNQLKLTGSGADTYVFKITADQLTNMNDFLLSVSGLTTTPTVVIDVTGTGNVSIHNNALTLSGTDNAHVLFNFADATGVTFNGIGFNGTMLAPNAAVNFSGNINGTLIAGSLSGPGEAHNYLFTGTLPNVPEPASLGLLAVGATALLRRRR